MSKKINPSFRIFSALMMIFVVAGHADFGVFDVAGMFPYYSFHVGAFVFISGYFYRREEEDNPLGYLKKKAVHLLLPYFAWNLLYGLFAWGLRSLGFTIGSPVNFKTLFIEPFLGGHQYGFNFSAWFVPALFLLELMNLLARKLLRFKKLPKDILLFVLSLAAGGMTVLLSQRGSVWGYYRHIGCLLFLFPIFQAGQVYRLQLEGKVQKLSTVMYLTIVCGLQYLVLLYSRGQVAYSAVWCSGFLHGPAVAYLTTFLGIAFWLKIAGILTPIWKEGSMLDRIGRNTFSIMMHHILGFFVLNLVFSVFNMSGLAGDFSIESFRITYEYRYLVFGMENGKWLYLIAGIGIPLLIKAGQDKLAGQIRNTLLKNPKTESNTNVRH